MKKKAQLASLGWIQKLILMIILLAVLIALVMYFNSGSVTVIDNGFDLLGR